MHVNLHLKKRLSLVVLGTTLAASLLATSILPKCAVPVQARESVFTEKGTGPLAWTSYEYQYSNNSYMPEDRWQKNIDWLAENFSKYGYDTAMTDGWIEGATKLNANGYILSHNDSWTHDWKYWGDYLKAKNMKLGVYYDPLWVSPTVIGNSNYKIVGTNIPVESITNSDDRFNGGQPTSLYWVDVTKPGAEQYVKGYVNYFKSCGAKVLRVDFLSWYEDGMDKGRQVGLAHGRQNYETALKWMAEACGDDMQLSLVMPHLYNDAEIELKYGDWIRVNEDCGYGDWGRFSELDRGTKFPYWSQYHNAFDGLIYWSKVSGKNKMILDADFLRLHNMYSDSEKKSAISLITLAGAPIIMADEYDTIGNAAWVYQNTKLLDLNKQGFIAKPFSFDPKNPDSMKWKGQLNDGKGSWIVGLFNRDGNTATKSIDFATDLGISGAATVEDLWTGDIEAGLTSYSAAIGQHDCRILKITPGGTVPTPVYSKIPGQIEAEEYASMSGVQKETCGEGGQDVGHIDTGDYMTYNVDVQTAGTYKVEYRVASINDTGKFDVKLDDNVLTSVSVPKTGDWQTYTTVSNTVTLPAGQHKLKIECTSMNYNLNWIKFTQQDDTPTPSDNLTIINPGFETGDISGWTATGSNYGVDGYDVHSGSKKLWFWSSSGYQQAVHQTKTNLANGSYTVKAWVKQSTGTPTTCRMEVANYGGDPVYINCSSGSEYKQYSTTVNVTNGKLDIGFFINAANGDCNMQIDDVELIKN